MSNSIKDELHEAYDNWKTTNKPEDGLWVVFVQGQREPKFINKCKKTIISNILSDPECCTPLGCYMVQVGHEILSPVNCPSVIGVDSENTVISVLDLAIKHAGRGCNNIIIYLNHGNNYDRDTTCEDFMFHSYRDINNFCQALFEYCNSKSDNNILNYEFPDHFTNDHFLIILDGFKDIYVTNFQSHINISHFEQEIIDTFKLLVDSSSDEHK